ncbi:MAG: 1-acyl-sn-glycerol-3-phosphate acyltransferase [Myxococcota bacterium]
MGRADREPSRALGRLAPGGPPERPDLDPFTAMTPRFGGAVRLFGERFFAGFQLQEGDAERLRALEREGAVVYVMRYSSRLDYLLFNWLFVQHGLRLSTFANGIWFYYYRPLGEALRLLARGLGRRLRRGFRSDRQRGLAFAREVVRAGGSQFLFLRTDKPAVRSRRRAVSSGHSERDYLAALVEEAQRESRTIHMVPLALFWRKGPRPASRFLNVFYGSPERPGDVAKLLSFLWNYRNLAVRVGTAIDLGAFVREHRAEGVTRIAKKVRRSLMIFLRREEKPVAGATLRPIHRIEEQIIEAPEVETQILALAGGRARRVARQRNRARRMLREIAASPSPTALAILDVVVRRLFQRLFDRIEVHGLERLADAAKLHPLVLVPTHRSHFDYLILSWLFYERHLVPPLVAAGINLAFWPLGPIFRRGGAYFLRRSFEGDALYSAVFRRYVQQLLRDGATQEFFIEGTRSRTGRTLPPRLGMLGMILEAWARGVRRDVFVVPVGLTYERVVEERSIVEERGGAAKTRESLIGLLRARSILRWRFGSAIVRFGEPFSLRELVGKDRHLLAARGPGAAAARRPVIESAGLEIARRLNGLVTATGTNLVAAVLRASSGHGVRWQDLVRRARRLLRVLEEAGVPPSEALRVDLEADLRAGISAFADSGWVRRIEDSEGEVLWYEDAAVPTLDYYRSSLAPSLAVAAALALAGDEAVASEWLDWLRLELLPPVGVARERAFEAARGAGVQPGERLFAAQIAPMRSAYEETFRAVSARGGKGSRIELERDATAAIQAALLLRPDGWVGGLERSWVPNALRVLVEERILEVEGDLRDPEARLRPGAAWSRLEGVRTLLAKAGSSG